MASATKVCTKCKEEKELSFFNKKDKDGKFLSSECRSCYAIRCRARTAFRRSQRPYIPIPDLEGEIWRPIKGWEGLYLISNFGGVKSISGRYASELILTPIINNNYPSVNLSYKGRFEHKNIHRLIALHFLENPENKSQVNHKDAIKKNSILDNLEFATPKENTDHARLAGLINNPKGEDCSWAILTEKDVRFIIESNKSNAELARMLNVNHGTVGDVRNGKNWSHITGIIYMPTSPKRLSEQEIIEIYTSSGSQRKVAKKFNISSEVVWGIRNGKYHSQLTSEINKVI